MYVYIHAHAAEGSAQAAICSVRERTSKARTAFPVGPLARIGGGCIEYDGPAKTKIIWIFRQSSLAASPAHIAIPNPMWMNWMVSRGVEFEGP